MKHLTRNRIEILEKISLYSRMAQERREMAEHHAQISEYHAKVSENHKNWTIACIKRSEDYSKKLRELDETEKMK